MDFILLFKMQAWDTGATCIEYSCPERWVEGHSITFNFLFPFQIGFEERQNNCPYTVCQELFEISHFYYLENQWKEKKLQECCKYVGMLAFPFVLLKIFIKKKKKTCEDFHCGPVTKDSALSVQGAGVQSLVRELDATGHN